MQSLVCAALIATSLLGQASERSKKEVAKGKLPWPYTELGLNEVQRTKCIKTVTKYEGFIAKQEERKAKLKGPAAEKAEAAIVKLMENYDAELKQVLEESQLDRIRDLEKKDREGVPMGQGLAHGIRAYERTRLKTQHVGQRADGSLVLLSRPSYSNVHDGYFLPLFNHGPDTFSSLSVQIKYTDFKGTKRSEPALVRDFGPGDNRAVPIVMGPGARDITVSIVQARKAE